MELPLDDSLVFVFQVPSMRILLSLLENLLQGQAWKQNRKVLVYEFQTFGFDPRV